MTFSVLILNFGASVVTGTVYSDGNEKTKLRLKEKSQMISVFVSCFEKLLHCFFCFFAFV